MKSNADIRSLCLFLALLAMTTTSAASPLVTIDIQRAYDMSVKNSTELKKARYEQMAERRRLSLNTWTYLPSLGLNLSDSRTTRYKATDTSAVSMTSTLSIPITQGGRKKMKRDIQRISLDLQELLLTKSEDEIKDTCFTLFSETHILRLKLKALRDLEEITKQQYVIAQMESSLGKIREVDLLETQVNVATLAQEAFTTESEIMVREYNLKKLLGLDQETRIELITEIDGDYTGRNVRGSALMLKSDAMRGNSDILQSRFAVEQSRINYRIAYSNWIPNVGLQASVRLSGEQYPLQHPEYGMKATIDFPMDLMPISFSFGISTTPDIEYGRSFSSGVTTPTSLESIVDRQLARMSFMLAIEENKSTEEDVNFQLDQYILEHDRLCQELFLMRQKMEIQAQKVAIMRLQLEIGQTTRVDYLEGENDLLNTRLDILSEVLSLIQAERAIEKTAGLDAGNLTRYGEENDKK